jgi:glycosyltransferase involved in cell wall biosynthesis
MSPLFSIITPSFNALAGLRRSFASVQAQSPDLLEYLIIDGASTDGSVDWLQEKSAADCRWLSEPDSGVYDAINKGIRMACGQFLYILGSGDELTHGILQDAAQFIGHLPSDSPRFIYGDVRLTNRGGRVLGGPFTNRRLCEENISHQAIFYERSIFEILGNYDLKYPVYSDWAFNFRCFGDRRIAKYYWKTIVADFEGDGLSDRVQDVPFAKDRPSLIRQNLGLVSALQFRLAQKYTRLRKRFFQPAG